MPPDTPERKPYCNHDPAAVDDNGMCECGEAVEGPALDALILDQIAQLLAESPWGPDALKEIKAMVRSTGRNAAPGTPVAVNPGTGPLDGATPDNAAVNMDRFCADLRDRGAGVLGFGRQPDHPAHH